MFNFDTYVRNVRVQSRFSTIDNISVNVANTFAVRNDTRFPSKRTKVEMRWTV